jgi:4'-phosphopantetheinyl transferase EntD
VTAIDPLFQREFAALAVPGLLIGHRLISPGDEDALFAGEAASIASPLLTARRASGAARIVARELLTQLGFGWSAIPKDESGAPVWPAGIIGSLAHDDEVAVAAVATRRDLNAVGIDVEPAVALPPGMLDLVATPREIKKLVGDPLRGKLLFAAKEAVYKAAYPLDRVFLEFRDIEVDLASRTATTKTGRSLGLRYITAPRIVVLALV